MKSCCSKKSSVYKIKVKGNLPERFSDWFEGMKIIHGTGDESFLEGKIEDQSALFGILIKVRDLGLPIISLERVE